MVASLATKGKYRCTRRRWHEGPCAAVPVDTSTPLRVLLVVMAIAGAAVGLMHCAFGAAL